MNWKHSIPQPPVPQFLRETLKDYPEIIQDIQEVLNRVVTKGPPRFDWAYDRLTDTLSAHRSDAYEALKEIEQTGDSQAMYKAKIKYDALVEAKHVGGADFDELQSYFETYKGAFE